jgi:hypothetical protein
MAVTNLFASASLLNPLVTGRSDIGTVLQHPCVRPWQTSILWAMVEDILPSWIGKWDPSAETVVKRYQAYMDKIGSLGLEKAIDDAPLVDVSTTQPRLTDHRAID